MTVSYFADHPEIVKIFKDLESFKEFCRFNAMRWNEANLYQKESREWRAYERNKSNAKHKFKRKFQKR
jgi:hypothetical protein